MENNLILRDLIAEKKHKLNYLIKSQQELKYVLLLEPLDEEISTAYYENSIIISQQQQEIEELELKLEEIDPAYAIERLNIKSKKEEEEEEKEEEKNISEDGVYL